MSRQVGVAIIGTGMWGRRLAIAMQAACEAAEVTGLKFRSWTLPITQIGKEK